MAIEFLYVVAVVTVLGVLEELVFKAIARWRRSQPPASRAAA
jgi:hypothetical protein